MKPIHKVWDTVRLQCPETGQLTEWEVMRITKHRRHGDYVYHLKYETERYRNWVYLYTTTELAKIREHKTYKIHKD